MPTVALHVTPSQPSPLKNIDSNISTCIASAVTAWEARVSVIDHWAAQWACVKFVVFPVPHSFFGENLNNLTKSLGNSFFLSNSTQMANLDYSS